MSTSRPAPGPGSVVFTVSGATLSEPGLRVLMGPADGAVEVVVRGVPDGSNGVELCPVAGVIGPPGAGRCVAAPSDRAVNMTVESGSGGGLDGGPAGVLLRPLGGPSGTAVRVPSMTFTYRPSSDSMTVVTPPLPPPPTPGDCPGGACEIVLELTPTGRGSLELDADGRGARPQLILRSGRDGAGSSRVVSVVEGGGRLRIRSTVEGPDGVSLTLRNLGSADLPPLELALVWPTVR